MTPLDYYFYVVDTLVSLPWPDIIFLLKIVSVLVTALALLWYLSTLQKLRALHIVASPIDVSDAATLPREIVAKPWLEIQQKMTSSNPADWSIAVIQADGVLDKILKASGYIGDTMGDRLKQINSAELNAIDDVWRSHKIRNQLAHGAAGALTRQMAEEAIKGYAKAFKELNYID
ncbi:MAG: hypothetical protein HYT39_00595 [Candidatus Sungbacteria bacterium]|nr:hypothetical protein [Candidatus Sungbacteria bacterium]